MAGARDPAFEFHLLGRAVSGQASARSRGRWQQAIEDAIDTRIMDTVEHLFLISDPLSVTIMIVSPVAVDIDLDNLAKPVLDAMKTKLYADDNLISRLIVERFHAGEEPPREVIAGVFAEGLEQLVTGDPVRQMLYVRLEAYAPARGWI